MIACAAVGDLDLLGHFSIAAEGQNDDVTMWCTACDQFQIVEAGGSSAANLLAAARKHWHSAHESARQS